MFDRPVVRFDAAAKPIDLDLVDSAALRRLVEEVQADPAHSIEATAYNRTYHRHNR